MQFRIASSRLSYRPGLRLCPFCFECFEILFEHSQFFFSMLTETNGASAEGKTVVVHVARGSHDFAPGRQNLQVRGRREELIPRVPTNLVFGQRHLISNLARRLLGTSGRSP